VDESPSARGLQPGAALIWLAVTLLAIGDVVLVAGGSRVDTSTDVGKSGLLDLGVVLSAASFASVGLALANARAARAIAWLLQLIGLLLALSVFTITYANLRATPHSSVPTFYDLAAWVASWIWQPTIALMLFLPVVFPDGRLPSPRWRPVAVAWGLLAVAAFVAPAFHQGSMQTPVAVLGTGAYLSISFLPIAAVITRFRRSRDIERAQLKWFVSAVLPLGIGLAIGSAFGIAGIAEISGIGTLLVVLGLIAVPVAIGIAILRYRLYDIDLLVNRTVLYGGVAIVLAAALAIADITAQRIVEATTGRRSDVVAAALGVGAALLFEPLRRRLGPWVDRILPPRASLTLLFTDIVGSTEHLVELGDEQWRDLLVKYRSAVRDELARFGGREVDTAGDSFFAVFGRSSSGVRCAIAIRSAVERIGLECRTGLHVGEVELRGGKVSGLAVHTAARVMAKAGAGDILISQAMRSALADSDAGFQDRGAHSLKGVPGKWQLYAVAPAQTL